VIDRLHAAGKRDLVLTLEFIPSRLSTGATPPIPQLIDEIELADVLMQVFQ
jgi:hypothetical protein